MRYCVARVGRLDGPHSVAMGAAVALLSSGVAFSVCRVLGCNNQRNEHRYDGTIADYRGGEDNRLHALYTSKFLR